MDFNGMGDDEILEAISETFEEDGRLNLDYLDFELVSGSLTVSGRVSSEDELQIIEEILEQLKFTNYKNDAWVDETLIFTESEDDRSFTSGLSLHDDGEIDDDDYESDDEDQYDI